MGQKAKSFLSSAGYATPQFTFISSPHFRTLQTVAYFQHELTGNAATEILLNSSIVVKNGSQAWRQAGDVCPFENGALAKLSAAELS